jgi:guanylate kinase
MSESKGSINNLDQIQNRFISIKEFEAMKPEDRQALLNYFASFRDVMNKFFVPFEEEQLLVDVAKYEKVNSKSLGGVLVISGPSGVGKDTAIKRLLELNPKIEKVVTAITRNARGQEIDGVDYHFLSRESFLMLLEARLFVDRAKYAENYYGMPKIELRKRIGSDAIVINAVPETARIIQKLIPESKTIVIMPPSLDEQMERLKGRGTEDEEKILARIRQDQEIFRDYQSMFDYSIISETGNIDGVAEQLGEIITKHK